MEYALYAIFFISCLTLVGSVLLQPGKTDAGALFTSNISSSAFAPRGTQTVLSKVTIISATVFMLSALLIATIGSGSQASLYGSGATPTPTTEATPAAQQPAEGDANTAAETSSTVAPSANTGAPEPKQDESKK